jgi:hypothetical protein
MDSLTDELGQRMARLGADNVAREYPNAPGHLLHSAEDLRPPRELHPSFYGSWDWHSSVHQHWLLARLLKMGRADDAAGAARAALRASLTPEHLAVEAAYLRERPTFERTYGWAWLFKLADELLGWDDPDARRWSDGLAPVVAAIRSNWIAHLPRAGYPIRAGTHANSAFGLAMALDHARLAGDAALATAVSARARSWFAADVAYPAHLEPGGDDFLSGALVEALLMARLLERGAFGNWLTAFLPSLSGERPTTIFEPATVADRSDPKTVHLDGLNLSRAWCWQGIGSVLDDDRAAVCLRAAERHVAASLPHLFSGEFAGEHWLASFALLALTG